MADLDVANSAIPSNILDPAEYQAFRAQHEAGGCGIRDLFALLGKPYVLEIIFFLTRVSDAPRRFVEIKEYLDVSPNTLSGRLKLLTEAGLLSRTSYNEIPPRVDYAPTQKARELGRIFCQLHEWTARHDLMPVPVPPSQR